MTILIADDEQSARKGFVEYLSSYYENILEAQDGLEAFNIYKENKIDLLITDVNMPYMDGLTLTENIRKENSLLPIIVISGYSDKDKLFRAIKLNLVEYIVKPVSRHVLKEVLDKVIINSKDDIRVLLSDDFEFNLSNKTLLKGSQRIELTKRQALLFEILVLNIGDIVASDDIFYHIHPDDNLEYTSASIRSIVKNLRKIVPEGMIKNIYGTGYMLHR